MATKEIPVWEKAALTIEEATAYTGIGERLIRSLVHASLHDRSDFPVFRIGDTSKIPRLPLLKWLEDAATSRRDLKRAAAMIENAVTAQTIRRRGRPRKQIAEGR